VLNYTRTFSPTLLNDFSVSFNRLHSFRFPPEGVPRVTDLGVKLNQQGTLPTLERINVSGFFSIGDSPEATFARTGFELQDRVNYIYGRHSMSFGASAFKKRHDTINEFQRSGRFTFGGNVTGNAMADFLLGRMSRLEQRSGEFKAFRVTHWAFFFQDDFKVNSRLTLNLGLRYEPGPPWHDRDNRFELFRPSDFNSGVRSTIFRNAPLGELFYGDPGVPEDGTLPDNDNLAPRVGFALDVFGDGRTSLRGGVGFFYNQGLNAGFNNNGVNSTPFSTRVDRTQPAGPFSDPYQGITDPFPAPPPNADSPFPRPVAMATSDERFDTPVAFNWNLTLERQIARDWLARVAYVASRGTHALYNVNLNPAVYIPGASTTGNTDARRMFAEYAAITLYQQTSNSHYHSLQATLNKRFAESFTVLANYTYSKALDNASSSVMPWYFDNGTALDWGPSSFDRRQRFVMSWVWDLPQLQTNNPLVRVLLNGWQATGIGQYQTGGPLTITAGRDNSLTGLGQDRAILTGEDPYDQSGDSFLHWFNQRAFAENPIGTFGTVGRGRFRGPSLHNWDMGFFKQFSIKERVSIQFRGEMFNIFNIANFADPATSVRDGAFGRITQTLGAAGGDNNPPAAEPRIIQFGLKLSF
jgi:hypothetical protein